MDHHPFIRCHGCSNILGYRHGALIEVKHEGRELLARVFKITCEKCGKSWPPRKAADTPAAAGRCRRVGLVLVGATVGLGWSAVPPACASAARAATGLPRALAAQAGCR